MRLQPPYDTWSFTGAGAMNGTFDAAAAVEGQSVIPPYTTDLAATTHGLIAGSLVYIEATENYDGLRKIISLPDANSMMIAATFVAETLANTDAWKTKFGYNSPAGYLAGVELGPPWEWLGFDLTLDAACGTAEDFEVTRDAQKGSAWDNLIYSKAMNTIQNINNMFDEARPMAKGDKIDFTFTNTDANTWGLKIYTRCLV